MATTLTEAVVEILGSSHNFDSVVNAAQTKLEAAGKKMETVGRNLSMRLSLPLAAVGGAAVALATTFDTEMTKIETLVGISRGQVDAWRGDLERLAGETSRGPNELAKALFVVTSAGARGAEALDILEQSGKAAASGLGETATIARAVTSAMQAYQKTGLTASQATDILVATVREGNLEADSLAGSLGRVLGPAAAVGASFADVGAFMATFTRVGVSAEEAATSLSAALTLAISPTKQARDAMEAAGFSVDDFRKAIKEKGMQQALTEMLDATEGNLDVIGQFIPNVRALRGILATAGSQGQQYVQIQDSIRNSTGMLDEAFKRTSETAGFKMKRALASLQTAGVALGSVMLPALSAVADAVATAATYWANFDSETLRVIATVVAVGAAIGPVVLGVGKLISVLGYIATPAGIAVAAALALGAAAYEMYQHWDDVRMRFGLVWAAIKDAVFSGVDFVLGVLERMTAFIPGVGGKIAALRESFDKFADESLAKSGRALFAVEHGLTQADIAARQAAAGMAIASTASNQLTADLDQTTGGARSLSAEIQEAIKDLNDSLASSAIQARAMGEAFNLPKEQAQAYKKAIDALVAAGANEDTVLGSLNITLAELAARYAAAAKAGEDAEEATRLHKKAIEDAKQLTEAVLTPLEAYNSTVAKLKGFLDEGLISQETYNRAVRQAGRDFIDAGGHALDFGAALNDSVGPILLDATDAFVAFAFGSGQAIKQFVIGAMADLARLLARILLVKALTHFFPGSGIVTDVVGAISGRASGGPVSASASYIVGEHGPELFQPQSSGNILSTGDLAAVLAGSRGGGDQILQITLVGQSGEALTDTVTLRQKRGGDLRRVARVPVAMMATGG